MKLIDILKEIRRHLPRRSRRLVARLHRIAKVRGPADMHQHHLLLLRPKRIRQPNDVLNDRLGWMHRRHADDAFLHVDDNQR